MLDIFLANYIFISLESFETHFNLVASSTILSTKSTISQNILIAKLFFNRFRTLRIFWDRNKIGHFWSFILFHILRILSTKSTISQNQKSQKSEKNYFHYRFQDIAHLMGEFFWPSQNIAHLLEQNIFLYNMIKTTILPIAISMLALLNARIICNLILLNNNCI